MRKLRQRVRLVDVAERANVSMTTASHVLNDFPDARVSSVTRGKVVAAARDLGYQAHAMARSLSVGKTNIVGFAISGFVSPIFATSFFSELIRGAGHGLAPSRHSLLLVDPGRGEGADDLYRSTVSTGLADGILLEGNFIKDEFVLRLENEGFPYVLVGRELPQREVTCVTLDYASASRLATLHLIQLGHRRIGFIGGPEVESMTNIVAREKGFRQALIERGEVTGGGFVVHGDDISEAAGYQLMGMLLERRPLPTAVFAASDLLAIGAMKAIGQNGLRIPEDIALVGFDDMPEASMVKPKLTTVSPPLFELGKKAAELLVQVINREEGVERKRVLSCQLIVRESCGGAS